MPLGASRNMLTLRSRFWKLVGNVQWERFILLRMKDWRRIFNLESYGGHNSKLELLTIEALKEMASPVY